MKDKKSVLYILITVLTLIIAYNYLITPIMMNDGYMMGMGMHGRMYNNNYIIDMRLLVIFFIIAAGYLLFLISKPRANASKYCKCGNCIESDRWKICPVCGSPVNNEKSGGLH